MSCGSTTCPSKKSFISRPAPFLGKWSVPSPFSFLAKIDDMHGRWRQRQQLLELDDHLLVDIGLSRREAVEEARKPFWK